MYRKFREKSRKSSRNEQLPSDYAILLGCLCSMEVMVYYYRE